MFPRPPAVVAALLLLASAGSSIAVGQPINCDKATATPELNRCADLAFLAAEAKMSVEFNMALAAIKASTAPKPYDRRSWESALRASQRAWVAYREAECKGLVPMSWTGGTGTTVAVLDCKKRKTEARIQDLAAIHKGP
jgi:uncharacterized protein YecT (DUF1311 family)